MPLFTATAIPGAGSPALRRRLESPGTGSVIHAGTQALYIRFGDRVIGIAARGAVQVPAAISTALPVLPEVAVGTPAEVRDGTLYVAGLAVSVDRLVPTALPRLKPTATLGTLPDLTAVLDQLPLRALLALAAGDAVAVPELLGRGDGLTPVGDDVIAGWLVTTRALAGDIGPVARAVREHQHRTTTLSATLLADAAEGETIPEFRALLLALAAAGDIATAVTRLVAVGHTSGAGMLLGADLALPNPERNPR